MATATPSTTPSPTATPTATDAPPFCGPWVQVNDDAFGLGDPADEEPPYLNEDGFEVAVHQGQLYLGMEADNLSGARLWRTRAGVTVARDQGDWELAVDDAFGDLANDHVDSLATYRGYLYATTANWDYASQIWRSPSGDPGTWTQLNAGRFGNPPNRNGNLRALAVIKAADGPWLCGGTSNFDVGAQVWCTADGISWAQKSPSGFGAAVNVMAWSSAIFDDHLYIGVSGYKAATHQARAGSVWRTAGAPDPARPGYWRWEQVVDATALGTERTVAVVDVMGVFAEKLYIAYRGDRGLVMARSSSGDPGTWETVVGAGFGDAENRDVLADGAVVHGGRLYVAITNRVSGAQVWTTADGVTWQPVVLDGWGDPATTHAQLVSWNGYLYAWASNYETGQKVYRGQCR